MPRKPKTGFREHPENINRKGRPRVGLTFAERVRSVLEEDDESKKRILIEDLILVAVARAKRGHFQFWDALMTRAYGKPVEKIEVNQDEKPDLKKLSDEELKQYMALMGKALSK